MILEIISGCVFLVETLVVEDSILEEKVEMDMGYSTIKVVNIQSLLNLGLFQLAQSLRVTVTNVIKMYQYPILLKY